MATPIISDSLADKVQVELNANVLAKLIANGLLRGNECRCLNSNAKKVVWQSLLVSSLQLEA
jgi:hypothetical protein